MGSRERVSPIYRGILAHALPDGFGDEWPERVDVPRELRLLWAVDSCVADTTNGGLTQFFLNDTGKVAPEAIEGFRLIGLDDIAQTVETASTFFGVPYPRARSDRQETHFPEEDYRRCTKDAWDLWSAANPEQTSAARLDSWNPFDGLTDLFYRGLGPRRYRYIEAANRLAKRFA